MNADDAILGAVNNNGVVSADYQYQLVIQFSTAGLTQGDIDVLFDLEGILQDFKGPFELDAHDIGSGEMNLFVQTDNPAAALEAIRPMISVPYPWRAAYRRTNSETYVPLFPSDLENFAVT